MASDSLLPASVIDARQFMFTASNQFNLNGYCHWAIKPPSEFTADLVLKIRIDKLYSSECYLNFGGSIITAGSEKTCQEGIEYSFTYQSLGKVSNVYLISIPTSNNAHIKFSYWAEPRMPLWALLCFIIGGIVLFSLLVIGILVFVIDCSVRQALEDSVKAVRTTFTTTIDEMEGKIPQALPSNDS